MKVGEVQPVRELSLPAVAGMRDQVDLGQPGRGHIPTVGFHRKVLLPQRARLGAPVAAPFALVLLRPPPPVDLPRADAQQLLLRFRTQLVPLADPGHPARQQGFQPHRPGLARHFPNRRQQRNHRRAVARLSSPGPVRAEDESHIFGDSRCSDRTRPRSRACLCLRLCGNPHRLPGSIPTSPRVPR